MRPSLSPSVMAKRLRLARRAVRTVDATLALAAALEADAPDLARKREAELMEAARRQAELLGHLLVRDREFRVPEPPDRPSPGGPAARKIE